MFIKSINGLIGLIVLATLTACGGGSSAPATPVVNGVIQKGPLVSISEMSATQLNDDGTDAMESKDLSDLTITKGAYQSFELPWTGWTRFSVKGAYIDENTGSKVTMGASDAPLTAVVFVRNGQNQVNINLFTTLVDELSKLKLASGLDLKTSLLGDGQQEKGAEAEIREKFELTPQARLTGLDLTHSDNNSDNEVLLVYSGAFAASPVASFSVGVDALKTDLDSMIRQKGGEQTYFASLRQKVNNVRPVGQDDTATTDEEQSVDIAVLDNDSDDDGDTLTVTNVIQPQHGLVSVSADGTSVAYTPVTDYAGNDSFTYTPNDGHFDGDVRTVTVTVNNINDAPVGVADSIAAQEEQTVSIPVLDNDIDADTADTLSIKAGSLSTPANGTAVIATNSVQYTPDANFSGTDTFTYIPTDGILDGQATTVTVTVSNVNDAPVGVADSVTTQEEQPVTIAVLDNDTDVDNDALSIKAASLSTPVNGTAVIAGNAIEYIPNTDFSGTDTFTYIPTDGSLDGQATTVSVTVTNVNDAPVLAPVGDQSVQLGSSKVVNISATDADGDNLQFSTNTLPGYASFADNSDGTATLTLTPPDTSTVSTDSITVTVVDGKGGTDTETITINVVTDVIAPSATGKLNDTAYTSGVDGGTGRDFTNNDNTNGYAGFDFTPLDQASRATSAANAVCVKDNVTGLIWEVKSLAGSGDLHDAGTSYALGSGAGSVGEFIANVNAANFCGASDWRLPSREELRSLFKMDEMSRDSGNVGIDTVYFPNTQASHKIDCVGIIYSDVDPSLQSLPAGSHFTTAQLATIQGVLDSLSTSNADYAQSCTDFTPQDYEDNLTGANPKKPRARGIGYATIDPATLDNHTWTIFFDDSEIDHEISDIEKRYVRLVRGTKKLDANTANDAARFQVNGDGTVQDLTTGLTWKRCLEGYIFNDNGTANDPSDDSCDDPDPAVTTDTRFIWTGALGREGQSFAGVSTWRVPNLKELASIAVYRKNASPAINSSVFPATEPVFTWTNTELPNSASSAWVISFGNGGDRVIGKSEVRPVRLVHD